ncbi:cerebellin 18 [Chanos chanos]|uniref:Cerebellin 18 n=1 Tax=Chanos chanos TaxID=29144 RepID=A0A6J2VPF5_CHACN|nr:complement C1q-like protein 2 [Chanos chanos]
MKTIAVATLGLLGALCLCPAAADATSTFDLMRETAVSWPGSLPCGGWDCDCVFRRQRGCCCVAESVFALEEATFMRMVHMWESLSSLNDQLGELTGERKVAFTAAMGPMTGCFGPFTSNVPIPYSNVQYNEGLGYNPALGTFTAQRAGLYSFTFTAFSFVGTAGERLYHKVQLMKNGQMIASVWEDNREDSEDSGTQTILLQLRRGCQVYVELLSGRLLCGDNQGRNTFSGYLVYPLTE